MDSQVLINEEQFALILDRLAHQLLEDHDFTETDLVGLQPRGTRVAERLASILYGLLDGREIRSGALDVTFHRDDIRRREKPISPHENNMVSVKITGTTDPFQYSPKSIVEHKLITSSIDPMTVSYFLSLK